MRWRHKRQRSRREGGKEAKEIEAEEMEKAKDGRRRWPMCRSIQLIFLSSPFEEKCRKSLKYIFNHEK